MCFFSFSLFQFVFVFLNFGLSFCKLLLIRLSCLKYNRQNWLQQTQETKHRVQAEPRPITNNESSMNQRCKTIWSGLHCLHSKTCYASWQQWFGIRQSSCASRPQKIRSQKKVSRSWKKSCHHQWCTTNEQLTVVLNRIGAALTRVSQCVKMSCQLLSNLTVSQWVSQWVLGQITADHPHNDYFLLIADSKAHTRLD